MRRRRVLSLPGAAALLVLVAAYSGFTASNAVPKTSLGQSVRTLNKLVDFKPPECAALTGQFISSPGPYTGGNGSDLIRGTAAAQTLNGQNGNDCLVGGGGADTLTGGAGTDVCIGNAGATFKQCEATVIRP